MNSRFLRVYLLPGTLTVSLAWALSFWCDGAFVIVGDRAVLELAPIAGDVTLQATWVHSPPPGGKTGRFGCTGSARRFCRGSFARWIQPG